MITADERRYLLREAPKLIRREEAREGLLTGLLKLTLRRWI